MKIFKDINYISNQYLDLYLPNTKDFPMMVFFHGGGIESGSKDDDWSKDFVIHLAEIGFGVATVNYALYPNTKFPEFLYQASSAIKYVFDRRSEFTTNKKIYVSGQSAGAYLTMMLCLNKQYLTSVGINPLDISGWISDSGQMTDHFNVMKYEKGLEPWIQRISEISPLFYVDQFVNSNPILLTAYEDDLPCRVEQNMLLVKALNHFNDKISVKFIKLPGGHCAGSCNKNEKGQYPLIDIIIDWLSI